MSRGISTLGALGPRHKPRYLGIHLVLMLLPSEVSIITYILGVRWFVRGTRSRLPPYPSLDQYEMQDVHGLNT